MEITNIDDYRDEIAGYIRPIDDILADSVLAMNDERIVEIHNGFCGESIQKTVKSARKIGRELCLIYIEVLTSLKGENA